MTAKIIAVLTMLFLLAGICLAGTKPVTDDQIVTDVQLKLSTDAVVKGEGLAVNVSNGVVTLTGTLDTQQQKTRAGKLAKSVKGVKQVVNNIVVKKR